MWDFSVGGAMKLMVKTMPFILLRVAVYFGITLVYILGTALGAGIGWGIGGLGDAGARTAGALWGAGAGFVIVAAIAYWLRAYLLYMVKAGHITVLVEKMDGRPLPEGRSQVAHARAIVRERFAQANVLFAVDQLVRGSLQSITRLLQRAIGSSLPGGRTLASLLQGVLRMAVGFIDEVILAYAIRTKSEDAWGSARTALVLYVQNYGPMLKNAVWLALIVYGLSFLVFLVMLAPAAGIAYLFPGELTTVAVVVALLLAWSFKVAVLDPFAATCMMQVYFKTIEGQTPDPEWEARLIGMSSKFKSLKDKAGGALSRGRPGAEPAAAPSAGAS